MSKENLTEQGFLPETSSLAYQCSYLLSFPTLYQQSLKLSTVRAQSGPQSQRCCIARDQHPLNTVFRFKINMAKFHIILPLFVHVALFTLLCFCSFSFKSLSFILGRMHIISCLFISLFLFFSVIVANLGIQFIN